MPESDTRACRPRLAAARWAPLWGKSQFIGFAQELNRRFGAELLSYGGLMVGNRLRIQAEDVGDLLDRLTSDDQAQHVEFALGQAVGIGDALAQGDALGDLGT